MNRKAFLLTNVIKNTKLNSGPDSEIVRITLTRFILLPIYWIEFATETLSVQYSGNNSMKFEAFEKVYIENDLSLPQALNNMYILNFDWKTCSLILIV